MTRPAAPLWKQLFDRADQRFSPTLNEFAKRDEVVTLAALALRGRAEVERTTERLSRRALHFLNLPAGSDVNRLLQHVARVEREVRDLRHQLGDRANAEYLAALTACRNPQDAGSAHEMKPPTAKKAASKMPTPKKPTSPKQVR